MRVNDLLPLMCCAVVLGGCGVSRTIAAAPASGTTQSGALNRIDAAGHFSAAITEFPLSDPTAAAEGPDGNLWVAADQLARVTPAGSIKKFDVSKNRVTALTSAFGKLWFLGGTFSRPFVAKMDVASGKFIRFFIGSGHCAGGGITAGPDGNVWFTDDCGASIVRVTQSGKMTAFPIPGGHQAHSMIVGPDGKLWFTIDDGGKFGKIDMSGTISIFPLMPAFLPRGLAQGPDGNVYIYDIYHGLLFRVTPQNQYTSFQAGISIARDVAIATGPDRRIWMLSVTGQLQTFDPATNAMSPVTTLPARNGQPAIGAGAVVSGSDRDIWVTAGAASYVGVIEP